ncbi:MAG: UbiA family prenyltransferase [Halobacteriaceae archaeon]
MAIVRHGSGPAATARALASQVHPVFMLPAVASSLFGALLAPTFAAGPAAVHVVAVFAGLYTAHVRDGYVDFYVRDEDDDHPLTARGSRAAVATSTCLFVLATAALWVLVGPGAAALTAPGWVVGYLHAPQLDTNPVTATAGYPLGVALALLGGYYAQAGTLGPAVVGFGAVFLLVLSGVKVVDDAADVAYDRSIAKRTVAVAVGPRRARTVAYGLLTAGALAVCAFAAAGTFPPTTVLAVVPLAAVAAVARRADPELATMLLVRGCYLFLVVLLLTT